MGKALVIVESPAKAKTINKYLGNDYVVKSSVGHIRDLPTSGSASKKSADSTATKGAKKPKKDERSALVNRMGVDPWHDWNAHRIRGRNRGQQFALCLLEWPCTKVWR